MDERLNLTSVYHLVPGAPPSNVSTYNISSTAIRVLWGPMPAALENGIILGFHLILMQDLNVKRNLTVSPRTREMVVTNLTKYTTYQVSLSGFTVIGSGVQSVPLSVTTNEDGNYPRSAIIKSFPSDKAKQTKRVFLANQKTYPDLGSATPPVQHF